MKCPECNGDGEIEYEYIRPMSFTEHVGGYYTEWLLCDRWVR